MSDFVASSPETVILGATFQGMTQALEALDVPRGEIDTWLTERGLLPLVAEQWYPWQVYLDFYRWVQETRGPQILRRFGRAIPKSAKFPPEIKTLDRALKTLDIAYRLNHKGGDIGGYICLHVEPQKVHLHCENPYGCDFDTGILEGLILLYSGSGAHPELRHAPGSPCRSKGGKVCIYEITW